MRPASILAVIVAACLHLNAVTSTPADTYAIALAHCSQARARVEHDRFDRRDDYGNARAYSRRVSE